MRQLRTIYKSGPVMWCALGNLVKRNNSIDSLFYFSPPQYQSLCRHRRVCNERLQRRLRSHLQEHIRIIQVCVQRWLQTEAEDNMFRYQWVRGECSPMPAKLHKHRWKVITHSVKLCCVTSRDLLSIAVIAVESAVKCSFVQKCIQTRRKG